MGLPLLLLQPAKGTSVVKVGVCTIAWGERWTRVGEAVLRTFQRHHRTEESRVVGEAEARAISGPASPALARAALLDLCPRSDVVVYLDSDLVVEGVLVDSLVDEVDLALVPDIGAWRIWGDEGPEVTRARRYFNAGVIVAWRTAATEQLAREWLDLGRENAGRWRWDDQSSLNRLLLDAVPEGDLLRRQDARLAVLPYDRNWLLQVAPPPEGVRVVHHAGFENDVRLARIEARCRELGCW